MVPKPNNGTLRLPLKPIGTHRPEDTPEQPADPPQPSTAEPSAAEPSTAEPSTAEPSNHPERPTRPGTPTQHERPTLPPQPSQTQEPAPSSNGNDKNKGDDDGEDAGPAGDMVKGLWDWLTDKAGHIWDKITGNDSDSD